MNRALSNLLLLPLLAVAVAACQTDKMPLKGFFTPPDGTLVLQGDSTLRILVIAAVNPPRNFRLRFNGMNGVVQTAGYVAQVNGHLENQGDRIYDYLEFQLWPWAAPYTVQESIPPGTYVVELVDDTGQSWGQSEPITVVEPDGNPFAEAAAVIFVHFDGQDGTWNIDPTTQDSDPTTAEITVTNLSDGDVAVDRCLSASSGDRTCTSVGTVAPGADLRTVETIAALTTSTDLTSPGTGSALVMHPAGSATPSYERPLVGQSSYVTSCALDRVIVLGTRQLTDSNGQPVETTGFAISSCSYY